ncbi:MULTISPECIES: NUDIX hydrolase [unclassified Fusibacter]|uniref:NUDIX hydrolase n=1 Tax=unclassified Fusibacter TaxID=2624464 RepID=UPI0013E971FE|nr:MULTISPECIES: NUDIX domain-containing protein [unclassified Fusibacter]MCK8061641.1 NUDIX domain-containing protein [Fusibacter sp. A2]NPE23825.1 NUDIX domain-containing protein [Fusibacter sp. A1]
MTFDRFWGIAADDKKAISKRVSAIAVTKLNGRFLMIATKRGYVMFPGGAVEEGESFAEAAARELTEETGYQKRGEMKYLGRAVTRKVDRFDHDALYESEMHFYRCDIHDGQVDLKLSSREIASGIQPTWMTKEEIIQCNRSYYETVPFDDPWVKMVEFVLEGLQ